MVSFRTIPALLIASGLLGLGAQTPGEKKALSLQEAISTALQNNLQVQIDRAAQEQGHLNLLLTEGAYDWTLGADTTFVRREMGNATTNSRDLNVGLTKRFDWGGSFNTKYSPGYTSTSPAAPGAKPYDGALSVGYTQTLLRGFGRGVSDAGLIISRRNAQRADLDFQNAIIRFVASTENLYWDLVYANRQLQNKKLALELAQKQLRENRIRVEVGTMAPIEITSAEAQVAQQEQQIIVAEAQLANAKDALLNTLFPNQSRPADLVLTEEPTVQRLKLSEEDAQKMALERRVDLKIARIQVENALTNETVSKQGVKPQLDLNVGYSTNANASAQYMDVNRDLMRQKNPGYSVGVSFSLPLQNRAAKATLATSRAQRRSSELNLRDQELNIMLDVRSSLRSVEAAEKGLAASRKTREYNEKDLDAEQKKFENGMSTNFVVLSKQSTLDASRANELNSQIAYAKAVTAFEVAVGNLLEARKLSIK